MFKSKVQNTLIPCDNQMVHVKPVSGQITLLICFSIYSWDQSQPLPTKCSRPNVLSISNSTLPHTSVAPQIILEKGQSCLTDCTGCVHINLGFSSHPATKPFTMERGVYQGNMSLPNSHKVSTWTLVLGTECALETTAGLSWMASYQPPDPALLSKPWKEAWLSSLQMSHTGNLAFWDYEMNNSYCWWFELILRGHGAGLRLLSEQCALPDSSDHLLMLALA